MISGNFRDSTEAAYAADAGAEQAIADLSAVADWTEVLAGGVTSSFVDGASGGTRTLPGGDSIDLSQVVNLANCESAAPCTDSDMDAVTPERPWGRNNPRWQLYAYGRLADLLPAGTIDSPYYVIVMVADDGSENDDDPLRDGVDPAVNPGAGVLALRAEALGARGGRKVIEATLARADSRGVSTGVRVLSWRETR
jgi:hypothetical protein